MNGMADAVGIWLDAPDSAGRWRYRPEKYRGVERRVDVEVRKSGAGLLCRVYSSRGDEILFSIGSYHMPRGKWLKESTEKV